tara:strand:+ start:935 stop:1432 length:498 start_codon:yes stop_codon:yes gene_type:complete
MWTIIKFDRKYLEFLKSDFKKKLGNDFIIYNPKIFVKSYKKNKFINKEFFLLGNYLLCFHKSFEKPETISKLKFTKGVKYFLGGFSQSQEEIKNFVQRCKKSENSQGYLSQSFFELCKNAKYKFSSGPFTEMIFKIIDIQKNKINILLGNVKTIINKNEFLFNPI